MNQAIDKAGQESVPQAPDPKKLAAPADLLRSAIRIYRQGMKKLIGMMLIAPLAVIAVFAVLAAFTIPVFFLGEGGARLGYNVFLSLLIVAGVATMIYVSVVSQCGVINLLKTGVAEAKVWSVFKASRKYFWPYFGASLLTALIVGAGSVFLIIPGIILLVYLLFANYAVVVEENGAIESIKRSWALVRGDFWPVFGRGAFILFMLFLATILLSFPLYFLENNGILAMAWNLVSQIALFLISPVYAVYIFLLFTELAGKKPDSASAAKPA